MFGSIALDVEYWRHQDVEVLDVRLDEYAAGLEKTLATARLV
jgi:hypothetical protein